MRHFLISSLLLLPFFSFSIVLSAQVEPASAVSNTTSPCQSDSVSTAQADSIGTAQSDSVSTAQADSFGTAQSDSPSASPSWRDSLVCANPQCRLVFDLEEETILVPGMEMFGPMYGYLNGKDIYGTWTITSAKVLDSRRAVIRLSNDLGSEAQAVELTWQNDSTLRFRQVDGTVLKRVEGRKLVKLPAEWSLGVRSK